MTSNVSGASFFASDFPTSQVGYMTGSLTEGGDIIKTADGGNHWFSVCDTMFTWGIIGCSFPDENNGYLLETHGKIYQTNDGGTTWQCILSDSTMYQGLLKFFTKDEGLVFLTNDLNQIKKNDMYRTTDGGINWTTTHFNIDGTFEDLSFPSKDTGFMVSSRYGYITSKVFKTVNGGLSWDTVCNLNDIHLNKIFFMNGRTGYSISAEPLYKTTDSGKTWDTVDVPDKFYPHSFWFFNENEGLLASGKGEICRTLDGGKTWSVFESGTNQGIYTMSFPTRDSGFIAGEHGVVLSIANATHLEIDDPPAKNKIPFSVLYPNPSNGSATIRFMSNENDDIQVIIYDVMGKQIKSIRDHSDAQGEHTVTFSTSGLSPGLYYYRLIAGDQIESGKFVRQ